MVLVSGPLENLPGASGNAYLTILINRLGLNGALAVWSFTILIAFFTLQTGLQGLSSNRDYANLQPMHAQSLPSAATMGSRTPSSLGASTSLPARPSTPCGVWSLSRWLSDV